jgi:hypothetical protein
MIFITPRPREPGDPPPPPFSRVLFFLGLFAVAVVVVIGSTLFLSGHPLR